MITPIRTMTIDQICERKDDLLIGSDDIKELAKNERDKAIDEFVERLVTNVESFQAEVNGIRADIMTEDYFHEYVMETAEQMKVE